MTPDHRPNSRPQPGHQSRLGGDVLQRTDERERLRRAMPADQLAVDPPRIKGLSVSHGMAGHDVRSFSCR
jgi:hypothetical protein